jgi:hypothetical protein
VRLRKGARCPKLKKSTLQKIPALPEVKTTKQEGLKEKLKTLVFIKQNEQLNL